MIVASGTQVTKAREARSAGDRSCDGAERALRDLVWRNGRIFMMFSPLWAHVVGVDMSPAARLIHRTELELARCHQLALMRRAASLPSRIERFTPGRFTCVRHGRTARRDEEPVQ